MVSPLMSPMSPSKDNDPNKFLMQQLKGVLEIKLRN